MQDQRESAVRLGLMLSALIGGAVLVSCGGGTTPAPAAVASPTPSFPGQSLPAGSVTLHVQIPARAANGVSHIVSSGAGLWGSEGPFRIDPATNKISAAFDANSSDDAAYIAFDGTSLWGSDYQNGVVRRYDAWSGKLLATISVETPLGIAVEDGSVWVASHHGAATFRIDPRTNAVVGRITMGNPGSSGPEGLAAGDGSVWVGVPNVNSLFVVNPLTGAVSHQITFPQRFEPCGDVAVTQTSVWISDCLDGVGIARVDPASGAVLGIFDPKGEVTGVAGDGTAVWFVSGGTNNPSQPQQMGYLVEISDSGAILRRIALGVNFISAGIAVADGSIWVGEANHPIVLRIPAG